MGIDGQTVVGIWITRVGNLTDGVARSHNRSDSGKRTYVFLSALAFAAAFIFWINES